MKRTCLALALALALPAFAQKEDGSVAKLTEMKGNVLVSRESGLATGNDALRLVPGTRVITTANAKVVVEYDNGCRVTLEENQRFEVSRDDTPCAVLMAMPQTIIVAPVAAVPIANAVIPAVLGGAGIAVLLDSRNRQSVSPN